MRIAVTIEGIAPLLMNRWQEANTITDGQGHSPVLKGERGTPREQAEMTAYRDVDTGRLYLPGSNLFAAITDAGKFHKAGRNKVTTQKSSLVPAGLMIEELMLDLGTDKFEVDSRRVVVPATGGSITRHRARLDKWVCSFTLVVFSDVFTEALARSLVDDAGMKIGVCDFRPAKRGPFGRFKVTHWERIGD